MPTNQTILVVGGAGYIGSHMVLLLQSAGYHVIVLDNLCKGHRDAVQSAKFIQGDMADKTLLTQLFTEHTISAVMHFASFIEVGESVNNPLKYYQNNVTATLNLLEVMLKNEVKQFIFSSTAAVYGEPQETNILESHPLLPINPYGRSKMMVEGILEDLAHSHQLRYATLRYFNAAGADPEGGVGERHDPESHLIPILLQVAAGTRDHITIYGDQYPTVDGTCVRDYVHVVDICQAHLLALKHLQAGTKNIVCNLGTGHGYSVLEVIHAARRVTGHPIPTVVGAVRPGDCAVLVADASFAKKVLHWQPQYTALDIIIQHAWDFMQSRED